MGMGMGYIQDVLDATRPDQDRYLVIDFCLLLFFNIHTQRFGSDASMSVRSNEYWVWTRKEELELELREMRSDRMRPDPTGSDQA